MINIITFKGERIRINTTLIVAIAIAMGLSFAGCASTSEKMRAKGMGIVFPKGMKMGARVAEKLLELSLLILKKI